MNVLLPIGIVLLLSFFIARFSHRLRLPAVVGYLLTGLVFGPSVLGLFDQSSLEGLRLLNDAALGIIAFVIGREIHLETLRERGSRILTITLFQQFGTVILVGIGVYLVGGGLVPAILLAALASASAPAGTAAVLQENKAKGPLTRTLYAIVGIDDGLAIVIFALGIVAATFLVQTGGSDSSPYMIAVREIGGAVVLGVVLGIILGKAIAYADDRASILELILGAVIACAGIAVYFEFSLILSNLILGLVVANFYKAANERVKEPIQFISLPVYVIFFILAGAHLEIGILPSIGMVGIVYIVARTIGKVGGAWLGGVVSGAEPSVRNYTGLGILSQAGVAVGLAVSMTDTFSNLAVGGTNISQVILNIIIGSTVLFEIIGPLGVKFAVSRAGEIGRGD